MSADEQYRKALGYYARGRDEGYPLDPDIITNEEGAEYRADFDRFLATVKHDAAREALDGLINECRTEHEVAATNNRVGGMVLELHAQQVAMNYRDTHYPEETP